MKRIIQYCFLTIAFCSCNNKETEYYDNGNIKKEYHLQDGKLDGVYNEYYSNGNLKESHKYFNGKKIDTSVFYTDKNIKKAIKIWSDSDTIKTTTFFPDGKKQSEGLLLKDKIKIGKWKLYSNKGFVSQEIEYFNIDGKEYLNQAWYFDAKGDTLSNGNYAVFKFKEHVKPNQSVNFLIKLQQPLLSYKSDVFVCLPKNALDDIQKDFGNMNQIEWDTLPSIKNQKTVKDYNKFNLFVSFALEFGKYGKKNVRGFLVEKFDEKSDGQINERKIFFDKEIQVSRN